MINNEACEPLVPWYRGFSGNIEMKDASTNQYSVKGRLEPRNDATVVITELPVGKWTQDYKQMIESMMIGATPAAGNAEGNKATEAPFIKDFKENHTDTTVKFTVSISPEKFPEIYHSPGGLQKRFKLEGSISTSNMHLFDHNHMIRKFENTQDILTSFFDVRLSFYEKRKQYLLAKLTEEWEKLDNKVRFILAVVENKLKVSNRKKAELLSELSKLGFKTFGTDTAADRRDKKNGAGDDSEYDEDYDEEDAPRSSADSLEKGYDYLLSMKIWSLTMERVKALQAQALSKRDQLDELSGKSAEQLYLEDLDALEEALDEMDENAAVAARDEERARNKAAARGKKGAKGKTSGRGRVAAAGAGYGSDDYDSMDDFIEDDSDEEYGAKKKKKATAKKAAANSKVAKDSTSAAVDEPFVPPPVPAGMVIKEPKVPRAPKAPKAVTTSSVAKPAPVAKSTAAMAKLKEQERRSASRAEDSDEEQTMSLFERLKLNNAQSSALSTLGSITGAIPSQGPSASAKALAKKKAAPAKKPAASKKKKTAMDLLSDDEDEDNSDMDMSDGAYCDDSEEGTPEKPKKAPKKSAASGAGVKRAMKGGKTVSGTDEVFSPGAPTPKATKSRKKGSSPPVSGLVKSKPAARKSAPKKKKATTDSEDDAEDEDDDSVPSPTPALSRAKSSRARAPSKNYADYFDEDEDDADDAFDEEVDDESEEDFSD